MALAAGTSAAVAVLQRLRGAVAVVAVEGRSMAPCLLPGDWLVIESLTYRGRPPRDGEIVVAGDPRDAAREVIKRAYHAPDGQGVLLRGDAADASTDSRTFGPLAPDEVRWRAVFRYRPISRAGFIGPQTRDAWIPR